MRAWTSLFKKSTKKASKSLTRMPVRTMAGGGKPAKLDKDVTHFDICLVGGYNATALTKFLQNEGKGLKLAIITDRSKFLCPELYFYCTHAAVKILKLESGSVASQVDTSSRADANTRWTGIHPDQNKIKLSNGSEYTYESLVLAPGFDHTVDNIKGLRNMEDLGESTNVFSHIPDKIERIDRNYHHGIFNDGGDFIVYDPAHPYKSEGGSFYPFYYDYLQRHDKIHGRIPESTKLQYWTPNKVIFNFPYANDIALEEWEKRGIEVNFGWELTEVKYNDICEKIATFKNVDTGETIERPFSGMSCNPPHNPQKEIVESGLADSKGLIDVNPYTLQHNKYDNVFAFGSATNLPTTRTQWATMAQVPIVKHNVQRFLKGKSLNAIYDGYTFMPLLLGQTTATSFAHYYDYEPHMFNHIWPHHGIFGRYYWRRLAKTATSTASKYSGFKKNYGPPYWQYNPRYDEVEHNEYLEKKGIDAGKLRTTA